MNELSVISDITSIASNTTTIITQLEAHSDTRTLRRAGAKLSYAMQTVTSAGQFARSMDLQGGDLKRANLLIDAFTQVAYNDIVRTLR